ncbi:hypothetical protein Glove_264g6 [Diversispora epigaea]|uniref:BACK domain-containing protein n=1 Tax=Diversispora epigaea TaxID=1348612 RepID=A0A397ICV1_9GLOM|nr:hypothetical protein Glove_264g6 [Diversispora epigaea]
MNLKNQLSATMKILEFFKNHKSLLKYIYGATVNLEKVETSVIFDLLMTANEFQLVELMIRLQTFLIENQSWLKLNFSKIYNLSFQTHFKALQNYCNESNDSNTLPESALVGKDFQILKKYFATTFTHIRYFQISNENIMEKYFLMKNYDI